MVVKISPGHSATFLPKSHSNAFVAVPPHLHHSAGTEDVEFGLVRVTFFQLIVAQFLHCLAHFRRFGVILLSEVVF